MVELGDKVKCLISGMEGIAVGRSTYLSGCEQICVKPQLVKDGAPVLGTWIDEPMLEIVEKATVKISRAAVEAQPGGPRADEAPAR